MSCPTVNKFIFWLLVGLFTTVWAGTAAGADARTQETAASAAVTVNGRPVSGPNSSARRTGTTVSLPVGPIARALGDKVSVDVQEQLLTVSRQDGSAAELDLKAGVVRENGYPKLSLSSIDRQALSADADSIYLSSKIFAALFDVIIAFDAVRSVVSVQRGSGSDSHGEQAQIDRGMADLYTADYVYGLSRYGSSMSHDLSVSGIGRVGDGRFRFNADTSVARGVLVTRNASVEVERPNGHLYTFGDVTAGNDLQLMTTRVRGAAAGVEVGSYLINAFGGRSYSGSFAANVSVGRSQRKVSRFDTNILGLTVHSRRDQLSLGSFSYSAGAFYFDSANRSGSSATGSIRLESQRGRLQVDAAVGSFSGISFDSVRVAGTGAAADVAGSLNVTESLSVHARFTRVSRRFLSPQAGVREPLDLKAAAISWSPLRWLSASVSATSSRRPGDPSQANRFVTSSLVVTPSSGMPRLSLSHTEGRAALTGKMQFTTMSASKEFTRWRVFANASRISNLGGLSLTSQFGASYILNDRNSIEASQGLGSRGSFNGQFDWRSTGLLAGKLSFTAGGGYHFTRPNGTATFQRLAASVLLPRQTSVQINLYNTAHGQSILVSLKGSLFRKTAAMPFAVSPIAEVVNYGRIAGRVYQDVDMNGQFDAGTDRPLAAVKVRIDGNRYVETDAQGMYSFDTVNAGDHRVYLDLLSVRADLTLLSDSGRQTDLKPGHVSSQDFRLVRTGRVSGWIFLDANENGAMDDGETPLPDVRVVTADGRDAMTAEDGSFSLSDLPPGVVIISLDPETLPAKTVGAETAVKVHVFSGRPSEIVLRAVPAPADVRRFPARP